MIFWSRLIIFIIRIISLFGSPPFWPIFIFLLNTYLSIFHFSQGFYPSSCFLFTFAKFSFVVLFIVSFLSFNPLGLSCLFFHLSLHHFYFFTVREKIHKILPWCIFAKFSNCKYWLFKDSHLVGILKYHGKRWKIILKILKIFKNIFQDFRIQDFFIFQDILYISYIEYHRDNTHVHSNEEWKIVLHTIFLINLIINKLRMIFSLKTLRIFFSLLSKILYNGFMWMERRFEQLRF